MNLPRRTMPGTDLDLSVICLGTVPIGGAISEDDSFRLLDAYVEMGGNFIDTAEIYSDWLDVGKSEAEVRLGKWLKARGLQEQVVVATKGGHPRWESLARMRLAPDELRTDIDGSRERLGLERLPLYFLHRDDPSRPVSEIVDVMAEAVDAGKIGYVACSNWQTERIAAAQQYAREHGRPQFVADQMRWSLARVNPESQSIPGLVEMDDRLHAYHRETGMAAVPYSSQAQGFFSGAYGRGIEHPQTRAGEKVNTYYYNEGNLARLDRVRELAGRGGLTTTQVALGYLLGQPFAVYPIIGVSSVKHLRDSCAAASVQLSAADVQWLETG
ncbi:MAG: aldo/keto reductase, partial [Planctomycetes bacterium]|nr:aldo/keto reductase [Planctomycetota bacterium]